jgi:hypothetical protein
MLHAAVAVYKVRMEDQTANTVGFEADMFQIAGCTFVRIVLFEAQKLHPDGCTFHSIRLLLLNYNSGARKIKEGRKVEQE